MADTPANRRMVFLEAEVDALAIVVAVLIEVLRKNDISVEMSPEIHDVAEELRAEAMSLADRKFEKEGWHHDWSSLYEALVDGHVSEILGGLVSKLYDDDDLARPQPPPDHSRVEGRC